MSEQADIEAALARATAAYKNVSAERDALKDANDRAEAAEAENDRLREALTAILDKLDHEEHLEMLDTKHSQGWVAWWQDLYDKGRAALAKGADGGPNG